MSKDDKHRRLGASVLGELGRLTQNYGIEKIPISEIDVNDLRFRTRYDLGEKQIVELSNSIKNEGLINPIIVRRKGDSGYQLVSGFRRLEAVKRLGQGDIEAIVASMDDDKAFRIAVSENLKRKSLTPLEIGLMCDKLVQDGKPYDEIGRLMGISLKQIQRYLRTLKLSEEVRSSLNNGRISFFTALEIGKVDSAVQSSLLKRVLKENLSTRDVVKLVQETRRNAERKNTLEDLPNVKLKKGQIIINASGDDLTKTLKAVLREAERGTIQKIVG